MKLLPTSILLFFGTAGICFAQDLGQALQTAEAGLETRLGELAGVRETIAGEKIPMAEKLNEVEEKVLSRRRQYDRMLRLRDNQALDLERLKERVKAQNEEKNYIDGLLGEYVRLFETRIHVSELQRYQDLIDSSRLADDDVNLSEEARTRAQLELVDGSLTRLEGLVGGDRFPGVALGDDGKLVTGSFGLLGPIAYFAGEGESGAGLAELKLGSAQPVIISAGEGTAAGIRDLIRSGEGLAPVDPTLGNALAVAETSDTVVSHIRKGGIVMIPILLLAFSALAVSLWKWFELSGIRSSFAGDLQAILDSLNHGRDEKAMTRARSIKGPIGEMFEAGVAHAREKKELIEEVLFEKILQTKPRLERLLPFIAVTAATAPLLGLLGTVTGMINTFKLITIFGTGDAKMLSSGISEALITTEFGLIIAIPALLFHAILSRKSKGILADMEQASVAFVNGLTIPARAGAGEEEQLVSQEER